MRNSRRTDERLVGGDLLGAFVGSGNANQPALKPRKALVYVRVSTDGQDEKGLSKPQQLAELEQLAARHDIQVVQVYQETGSAYRANGKRHVFEDMLAKAKSDPEITDLLVHDMSRFSRNTQEALKHLKELDEAGVRVKSLNDPDIDMQTGSGLLLGSVTFAKNELYSLDLAMHTRKGCKANLRTRDPVTGWAYKNGGKPKWGYASLRSTLPSRQGRLNVKSVWVKDETVQAGRPVWEWTRDLLLLAGRGESLDQLTRWCNASGIPSPKGGYWGESTVYALLTPDGLLKYSGTAIWNVHGRKGRHNSPADWIIEEDAHPAIITRDEANAIWMAREGCGKKAFGRPEGRARSSPYLLSGGLFKCGRCGKNMIGLSRNRRGHYVCGSQPYRKGMGCGPGVYIRVEQLEAEVLKGVSDLLRELLDPKKLAKLVNAELDRMWKSEHGAVSDAEGQLKVLDASIGNFRRAVERGIDVDHALDEIARLQTEQARIEATRQSPLAAPRIDVAEMQARLTRIEQTLAVGSARERKELIRMFVQEMTLAPETLEISTIYRVPEAIMNKVVAGVGFEPTTFGL